MKTKMRYIRFQLHNYCLYSQVSFQTFRTVMLTALKEVTATNQPFHHYLSLRDFFFLKKSLIN